ncbi:MAG TPA: NAD(P)-dependent oxidoreductase [Candidatus Limnocylindria bacterium]|nr:NAD(P)-dependent oxidoreductase [Candidatus Limnocylindria bacterium]
MVRVAVVGTGRMGSAMARALAQGGATLVLHNRTLESARSLAQELGASVATTPREAAAAADVAITMLADGDAVRQTWDGPNGLVAGAHDGGVLVDASTVPPDTITAFETAVRERGSGIVDAPVSGSTKLATDGQLTIMAGGRPEDLERAKPALDLVARHTTHVGPLGSGAALKLAVNALIFALNNSLAEALVLAERAGIDPRTAYEVFASSAAGAPYVGYKRDAYLAPDETPTAFSLDLALKDLGLILGLADRLGVPTDQIRVNQQLIGATARRIGGDRDMSAVAVHLREQSEEGARAET